MTLGFLEIDDAVLSQHRLVGFTSITEVLMLV